MSLKGNYSFEDIEDTYLRNLGSYAFAILNCSDQLKQANK